MAGQPGGGVKLGFGMSVSGVLSSLEIAVWNPNDGKAAAASVTNAAPEDAAQ